MKLFINVKALYRFIKCNLFFAFNILLCLSGFYIFATLASEILEDESFGIDTQILLFFRDDLNPEISLGPSWLHEMMRDMKALGGIGVLTIITVAVIVYLVILKEYMQAIYIPTSAGTGVFFKQPSKDSF